MSQKLEKHQYQVLIDDLTFFIFFIDIQNKQKAARSMKFRPGGVLLKNFSFI